MATWYIVINKDDDEVLGSCMTKKEAGKFLEAVKNGTKWSYRNAPKYPNAYVRKKPMTEKEKNDVGFHGF